MSKKGRFKLKTPRLVIRDLGMKDAPAVFNIVNDEDIYRGIPNTKFPLRLDHVEAWMRHCETQRAKKPREQYQLGIRRKYHRGLIGEIELLHIKTENRTANLGYWIGREYRGEGYALEAAQGLITFAFSPYGLNLRRLEANCIVDNHYSEAILQKLGFQVEGLKRQGTRVASTGEIFDTNLWGLLKEEFSPIAE
jgi:RimJ/RimL family protein N-acetyltransferase